MRNLLAASLLLLASLAPAQSVQSVHLGSVLQLVSIQGGDVFTLTLGGPGTSPCYVGNGFCWASGGSFVLYKSGAGSCAAVCQFTGTVGSVSTVSTSSGCSQISFAISNADLQIGSNNRSGLSAWYSQTSCSQPSGFMGGGTLLVFIP
jgi:hypothetical protein